jgi:hypothetical protein
MRRSPLTARTFAVVVCLLALAVVGVDIPPARAAGTANVAVSATERAMGPHPRVVVIVGPVGSYTSWYRQLADGAAQEARRFTDDVTTVYSPNATWPAVRSALQGASLVVYLGHGNGWPSKYRSSPYPASQNGLGLNPVSGGSDRAHEYFGESYIQQFVRLAPGAVVLLHHLCYASGNSEPGLPEDGPIVAQQRVDNYAAGWLRTGAAAVVAEGHLAPAYYVRSLLSAGRSVESIWRASPNFHGNVITAASERTPGARLMLDPDTPSAGFYRSLALRGSAPGVMTPTTVVPLPSEPSLAQRGTSFGAPAFGATILAGEPATVRLPVKLPAGAQFPAAAKLAVRWTSIDGEAVPGATPGTPEKNAGAPNALAPSDSDLMPPEIDLVVPEVSDEVIEPQRATRDGASLRITGRAPARPGLYRVITTIYNSDGIAYDAPTQALIPVVLVRVTPALSARYGVVSHVRLEAGISFELPVRLLNSGRLAWSTRPMRGRPVSEAPQPTLVARWLALDESALDAEAGSAIAVVAPGQSKIIRVPIAAPAEPGAYLLVVDVDVPGVGPLAARGVEPAIVRIDVSRREPKYGGPRRPTP